MRGCKLILISGNRNPQQCPRKLRSSQQRISNCKLNRECAPSKLRLGGIFADRHDPPLTLRVSTNHTKTENSGNCVPFCRLESHGQFLFARDQLGRECVFDIKEAYVLLRTAPFTRVFSHFCAVDQNIARIVTASVVAESHCQDHWVRRIDRQIKGEPLCSLPSKVSFKLYRRGVFTLLRKIAFRLHLARLCEGH